MRALCWLLSESPLLNEVLWPLTLGPHRALSDACGVHCNLRAGTSHKQNSPVALYPPPHHNQEPTFQLQVPRLTVTPKGVAKRHQDNGTSFFSPTPRRGAWLSLLLRTFLCLGSSLPVSDIISEEFRVVCTKGKNASHSSTFLYM